MAKKGNLFAVAIGVFATVMIAVLVLNTTSCILPALLGGETYELTLPGYDDIDSATLARRDGTKAELTTAYAQDVLFVLKGNERSTRTESIQDAPVNAEDWIQVDFHHTGGGTSTLFVYQRPEARNGEYFIEQPYNGIYQISGDEYNSIEKYVGREAEK